MFWRFGSLELSLPVAVTAWLKLVWMRPVRRETNPGSFST